MELLSRIMGGEATSMEVTGPWSVFGWEEADSTNSRALEALRLNGDADLDHVALHVARQSEGRGQQQRPWTQAPGKDLAMTLILTRKLPSATPFALNLAISLAVLQGIEDVLPGLGSAPLEIKWPNDIMWQGRKAGGILIENSWRGQQWTSAVIGIGINLGGTPPYPNATALLPGVEPSPVLRPLRQAILERTDERLSECSHPDALLRQYHQRLHGWGRPQRWQLDGEPVSGILECIDIEGRLCVATEGRQQCFSPGEVGWLGMEP